MSQTLNNMKHGSLFSGIGGFDLAAQWMGWENVFHCEIEEYKRAALKKNFPNVTSYADITKTNFTIHRGGIDILTGGFPCQDASQAKTDGQGQQGIRGGRTGLIFDMLRCISEIQPKFVVAENVSNILKVNGGRDFGTILYELSRMGYNAEWRACYASEVGAPHKRKRLYLVAYSSSIRVPQGETFFSNVSAEIAQVGWEFIGTTVPLIRSGAWSTKPPVLCLGDGVSRKLVRQHLHGYGNAIVPQIAFEIFKAIEATILT